MSAARKLRVAGLVGLATLLCACPTRPRDARPGPAEVASTAPQAIPEASGELYKILADQSLLTVLVYRGGPLARAGHNHVIASRNLAGTLTLAPELEQSRLELRFPVATLTVDEPELRAREGSEFPPDVPESARSGTRANMLGKALLDAESFPDIVLRSERITRSTQGLEVQFQAFVRDQVRTLTVPVSYHLAGSELVASGEKSIKQTELGLTPFSALMGALQVRDEMSVKFQVVARRVAGN